MLKNFFKEYFQSNNKFSEKEFNILHHLPNFTEKLFTHTHTHTHIDYTMNHALRMIFFLTTSLSSGARSTKPKELQGEKNFPNGTIIAMHSL